MTRAAPQNYKQSSNDFEEKIRAVSVGEASHKIQENNLELMEGNYEFLSDHLEGWSQDDVVTRWYWSNTYPSRTCTVTEQITFAVGDKHIFTHMMYVTLNKLGGIHDMKRDSTEVGFDDKFEMKFEILTHAKSQKIPGIDWFSPNTVSPLFRTRSSGNGILNSSDRVRIP